MCEKKPFEFKTLSFNESSDTEIMAYVEDLEKEVKSQRAGAEVIARVIQDIFPCVIPEDVLI